MKSLTIFYMTIASVAATMAMMAKAQAVTITRSMEPDKDNTLYESGTGNRGNGAGQHFFAGRTGQLMDSLRRGLLHFDVSGNVCAGSTIDSASLVLNLSKTSAGSGPHNVELRRLLADWGEGTSDALGSEGGGAPATIGDATWLHTFSPTASWAASGGDFITSVSASQIVDDTGSYIWGSTGQMAADVQDWLDNPVNNFGWILIGNESSFHSAKRFDSRNNPTVGVRPMLTITFTVIDATSPAITCPADATVECTPDVPAAGFDCVLALFAQFSNVDPSSLGSATATDGCDPAPNVDFTDNVTAGSCPQETVLLRTWTATDQSGNSASCLQTISIIDTTAPVITCPADVTIECDESTGLSNTGNATATDNCDLNPAIDFSDSVASGTCPQESVITRTWTATDACGNSTSCDQVITVDDSTAPIITCPADVTIECDESANSANLGSATATDNCDSAPVLSIGTGVPAAAPSVARQWSEALLQAIRQDLARPTVHARNLFHTAVAMYDAWAVYDAAAGTFLLGKTVDGYTSAFTGIPAPGDKQAAQKATLSHAVYRLLSHRFAESPGAPYSLPAFDALFAALGYNAQFTSTDYSGGSAEALGNYIAETLIDFGNQDGANEQIGYSNIYYQPVNPPLVTKFSGNPDLIDPNRWQPLTLDTFIDQGGNEVPFNTPPFLSPEWGNVTPFALQAEDLTVNTRDGNDYWTYHDPGAPPYIDATNGGGLTDEYRWNFELVAIWSSHLDPADMVMWDISPAAIGNVQSYPTTVQGLPTFYDLENGGDHGIGHDLNPHTGQPYAPQLVKRADYARVLAEFWADGPDSETPPGHWFTLLNYVSDHPQFEKRFRGQGDVLDDLEWDVKAFFLMGGAMHDAAVAAWGAKGWYDYIRPISAIRWLADLGQHSVPNVPSFHPAGISLINDYIELVEAGDPLAGANDEHVGKIKVKSWRGPDYIVNPETDIAGVDWILAENWWSYQRPTFVTPPFAGYVSGHSTYSRAAAEVMTLLTGDPFFPGGMAEFIAEQNSFLVFEDGPSADVILQWATYRDASDQCSLSRIWGGIHPPADDIPGRLMGIEIGIDAFAYGEAYFTAELLPPASGPCPYPSTITRTWTATDACGNSSSCTQTATVVDSTAPVITCPADMTIESDPLIDPGSTGVATATDTCDPASVVTFTDSVFSETVCPKLFTITRTWEAADQCGNASTCEQTICVVDTIVPTLITGIVEGGLPQRSMLRSLGFQFSEDVSASLEPGDLVLENLTTTETIDPGVMTVTYDSATNTATWIFNFPGPFFESLPDGNYCATLPAAAVEDLACNNPSSDVQLAFHRVFGDRDGDTDVDFLDSIRFRTCFFAPPNCDFRFDVDSDTDVDFLDLINFGSRFPSQLAPVPCP